MEKSNAVRKSLRKQANADLKWHFLLEKFNSEELTPYQQPKKPKSSWSYWRVQPANLVHSQ